MENKHTIKGMADAFEYYFGTGTRIVGTQPSHLFTVSQEDLWGMIGKLKWLLIDKAHHIVEEHFGDLGTLWYRPQEGSGTTLDSEVMYAKNVVNRGEQLAGDGAKKKPHVFFSQAVEEAKHISKFNSVKSYIEVYPPGSISSSTDDYVIRIPFHFKEIYPPVSHGIEHAKYLADVQTLEEFNKKKVDFDMSKLQPVSLSEVEDRVMKQCKTDGNFFKVDVVNDEKLSEIINDSIARVYAHLYEYSKGKEVIDRIEEKREVLKELKVAVGKMEELTKDSPLKVKTNPNIGLAPEVDPTVIEKEAVEEFDRNMKEDDFYMSDVNRKVSFMVDGFPCLQTTVKATITDEELAEMGINNSFVSTRLKEKLSLPNDNFKVSRAATKVVIVRGSQIVVNITYNPEWIKRVDSRFLGNGIVFHEVKKARPEIIREEPQVTGDVEEN